MTQRFLLGFLALIVLNLSACDPIQHLLQVKPTIAPDLAAIEAEKMGDYAASATAYFTLAENTKKAVQANYYLRAALAFWQVPNIEQASTSLAKVNRALLSEAHQLDANILDAQIALSTAQAEQALHALEKVSITSLSQPQQLQVLGLRAQAYTLTENWLETANSYIALMPLLSSSQQIKKQTPLWHALLQLTPHVLELFNPGIPPEVGSGWFALAYIIKEYKTSPNAMTVAIEDWKRNYPRHPALPSLYEKSMKPALHLPKKIAHIAILLPNKGVYKTAATAIKKGILAAHFNAQSDAKLKFYTVSTDRKSGKTDVWQQYQTASQQGASIIIGPLDKLAVQALSTQSPLNIPILALNRLANNASTPNMFQFSLAPEDDALTVANHAIQQGFKRAVILSPQSRWGDRIASAFTEQWLDHKGVLLNQVKYDETQHDFSNTIQPLLGLESSTQRYHSLKKTTGRSLEFEPRRRQDIDFIFLIAKPLKARQLVPQLKFHCSGKLPILATSHAFSGEINSQQDIDLNGLQINNIPWSFAEHVANDPIYTSLSANPPPGFKQNLDLYALGVDAYHFLPKLSGLTRSSDLIFQGATGILSINSAGRIIRNTPWGQFEQGLLQPLSPIFER